jgi:hypothetical protein
MDARLGGCFFAVSPLCATFSGVLAFYVVICSPFPSIMKLRLYDRKTVFSGAGQIQAER